MQQIAYFVPLFLLVFGLSASVDVRQAWVERKRFGRGVVCGLLCQFVLLPFLGFCVVKIFDLGEVYGVNFNRAFPTGKDDPAWLEAKSFIELVAAAREPITPAMAAALVRPAITR